MYQNALNGNSKTQKAANPASALPCPTRKESSSFLPQVDLKQFRYVITVAEELNFGRAAAHLNMTQPPLSQQIQKLEQLLSVKLFDRTKRYVRLTEPGRILVREGRRILAETEEVLRLVSKASRGETGVLRLGYVRSADNSVAEILKAFARHTPNVQFELHSMSTAEQLHALHAGRIQLGFLQLPISDPDLTTETIFREPLVAALPQEHPLAAKKLLSTAALAGEQLVLGSRFSDPGLYDSIVAACKKSGFDPNIICETDDTHASLALVAAGLGIALFSSSIQRVHRSGVVLRSLQSPVPETEVAAAYLSDNGSQVLQNFLGVLRDTVVQNARAS
jgi:DNA-binding transcriptional LysR family regulator